MHGACGFLNLGFIYVDHRLDFHSGDHLDVELVIGQGLEHFRSDTAVASHANAEDAYCLSYAGILALPSPWGHASYLSSARRSPYKAMCFPDDAILATAFFFELARGVPLGQYEVSEIQKHGLNSIDPELLARKLRHLITTEHKGDSKDRQQAYWALGKKRDSGLISFFRDQLRLELGRDMIATYQIMIALQDIGEPTFGSDRSGYSFDDYELNRRDAESYLEGVSVSHNHAD